MVLSLNLFCYQFIILHFICIYIFFIIFLSFFLCVALLFLLQMFFSFFIYITIQYDNDYDEISSLRSCPIDSCSGVVLHLFTSSPQDLPEGAHDSVPTTITSFSTSKITSDTSMSSSDGGSRSEGKGVEISWSKVIKNSYIYFTFFFLGDVNYVLRCIQLHA